MTEEPGPAKTSSASSYVVLAILSAAMFIYVIDTTVMNVSISALVEDLNTTVGAVQAAITLYTLTMASFMLTGGKLGDIWGSKRAFRIGLRSIWRPDTRGDRGDDGTNLRAEFDGRSREPSTDQAVVPPMCVP